jgi:hypothetical protein
MQAKEKEHYFPHEKHTWNALMTIFFCEKRMSLGKLLFSKLAFVRENFFNPQNKCTVQRGKYRPFYVCYLDNECLLEVSAHTLFMPQRLKIYSNGISLFFNCNFFGCLL